MKPLYTVIALFVFFIVIATAAPASAGETRSVTLKIEGMSCSLCVPAVKKALSQVEGVSAVHVSFDEKEARIRYEKGRADIDEMIKAVESLGFTATLKKDRI